MESDYLSGTKEAIHNKDYSVVKHHWERIAGFAPVFFCQSTRVSQRAVRMWECDRKNKRIRNNFRCSGFFVEI